ncbi:hypothetical protein NCAS_0A00990 [Naumovozyma castellii]|uniref:WAC domain-containing protein n=1 Tax=Naumovozyma castellii TaxID=27288 RepID=G0V5C3_NAUCA|nr:hypothetical protein NCAS_0A00990 [Naumovozyma castellii CBS 4309]CCC66659.1 hypothetical protein NCAS_0A00990 [Naumovozyma castellii CBS 4309]
MVLYHDKHFELDDPIPLPTELNTPVWVIEQTGEWFTNYEEYDKRMTFYKQPLFTCEITGRSHMTYFEAKASEERQTKHFMDQFPSFLKSPIANWINGSHFTDIEKLIEIILLKCNKDFFVGEKVNLIKRINNDGIMGSDIDDKYSRSYLIKSKEVFEEIVDPGSKETIIPGYSKYLISSRPIEQRKQYNLLVDHTQISRKRPLISPHLLKCFVNIISTRKHLNDADENILLFSVKSEYRLAYGVNSNDDLGLTQLDLDEEHRRLKDNGSYPSTNEQSDQQGDVTPINANFMERVQSEEDLPLSQVLLSRKRPHSDVSTEATPTPSPTVDLSRRNVTSAVEALSEKSNAFDNLVKRPNLDELSAMVNQVEKNKKLQKMLPNIRNFMDDLELPYLGPPKFFQKLYHFSTKNFEYIPVSATSDKKFEHDDNGVVGKLLQVYEFVIHFGHILKLSPFSLDDLITSMKCTDMMELNGELVTISIGEDKDLPVAGPANRSQEAPIQYSEWKRNPKMRNLIKRKCTSIVKYDILINDAPRTDEFLENIKEYGAQLIVEVFIRLLSMIIDEKGNWRCNVVPEWVEDENIDESLNKQRQQEIDTIDEPLNKVLNYRNTNWADRLQKRQFNDGYWLIILLGVLQDSMHISMYTDIVQAFTKKIIPPAISVAILNKQLYKNFCFNFTIKEKIEILWVLTDIVESFSMDIKKAVDSSQGLCNELRYEKLRISKELVEQSNRLTYARMAFDQLERTVSQKAKEPKESEQINNSATPVIIDNNGKSAAESAPINVQEEDPESLLQEKEEQILALQSTIKKLEWDQIYLEQSIKEQDLGSLKPLGMDRYGNNYYWLEYNGISNSNLESPRYYSGRIWVRGPSRESAKYFLKITDKDIDRWFEVAKENGATEATKTVFNIYQSESGAFYQKMGDDIEVELLTKDKRVSTSSVTLTPLQKKIIDETPQKLLISDKQWYCFDTLVDVRGLLDWLDQWGNRESKLLHNLIQIHQSLGDLYSKRENILGSSHFDAVESRLLKELNQFEFSSSEITSFIENLEDQGDSDSKSREKSDEISSNVKRSKEELENTAREIVKLNDCKLTRNILVRVQKLENKREMQLKDQQRLLKYYIEDLSIPNEESDEANQFIFYKKLRNQRKILTDLLNHRHFRAIGDVLEWKNDALTSDEGNLSIEERAQNKLKEIKETISNY